MIPAEECMQELAFTYLPEGAPAPRSFAVARMQARIARMKAPEAAGIQFGRTAILPDHAQMLYRNSGIEQHRLRRLFANPCREPILYLDWGDGTQVLADGNHRYVSAYLRNEPHILMMLVPPSFWGLFEIDMSSLLNGANPEAFKQYAQSGFSGIH